jgi:hypothetical protein
MSVFSNFLPTARRAVGDPAMKGPLAWLDVSGVPIPSNHTGVTLTRVFAMCVQGLITSRYLNSKLSTAKGRHSFRSHDVQDAS